MRLLRLTLLTAKQPLRQRRVWRGVWGTILFSALLPASCVKTEPRVERLFPLFIQPSDLPVGWYRDAGGIGDWERESEGIISRWVQFRGVPEQEFPTVLVIQDLIDYPDFDSASVAYAEIVKKEFPVEDWVWPKQIVFVSQADQFRLACLERGVLINGKVEERLKGAYFCSTVGQYGTTVSIVYANVFQDQWLTFEDLQHLLEAADARLANQP